MQDNPTLMTVLIIAISVLVNLIITLVIRRKDRDQKTIKNINNQIQTFRSEVSALSERIRALGQETLQNVDAKTVVAEQMVSKVAEGLESLAEHSKDLSALQSVCVSYKNALDKLRIATDQAEARIKAVQDEVRKAETVNDFIRIFQADAQRLTGEMNDLKDEYARLVASTGESLRQAAENQKNENQDMLQEFAVAMEGFKSRFTDFVASEKESIGSYFQENADKAAADLQAAEDRRDEILKSIDDGRAEMASYRSAIDAVVANAKETVDSLDAKASAVLDDVRKSIDDEKAILSGHAEDCGRYLSEKEEAARKKIDDAVAEAAASCERSRQLLSEACTRIIDEGSEAMDARKAGLEELARNIGADFDAAVNARKAELDADLAGFISSMGDEKDRTLAMLSQAKGDAESAAEAVRAVAAESLETLDGARNGLDQARGEFIASSADMISRKYDELMSSADERYGRLRDDADELLRRISDSLLETRETISILSEGETEKITETVERLEGLGGKIKGAESQLAELQEKITATRKEIFDAQQERSRIGVEIDQQQKVLHDFEDKLDECRREMDEKKAEIVRLKVERDKLAGRAAKDDDASAQEEPEKESRYKDMIEEFPEDIFTGAVEDVDLSDESDS